MFPWDSLLGWSSPWILTPTLSGSTEDGADLESIETVANEVLQMQMPTTPAQLQNLTAEIRERVGSLTEVEDILNQSATDILRAENLLEQARKARSEIYSVIYISLI